MVGVNGILHQDDQWIVSTQSKALADSKEVLNILTNPCLENADSAVVNSKQDHPRG